MVVPVRSLKDTSTHQHQCITMYILYTLYSRPVKSPAFGTHLLFSRACHKISSLSFHLQFLFFHLPNFRLGCQQARDLFALLPCVLLCCHCSSYLTAKLTARECSVVKKIDIDCRSDLSQETICSLLSCKLNMGDACRASA